MFRLVHAAVPPRQATAIAGLLLIASFGAKAQVSPTPPQPFVEEIRQQERERALREQQERAVDVLQPPAPGPTHSAYQTKNPVAFASYVW